MANADGSVMIGASKMDFRNAKLSLSNLTNFARSVKGSSLPMQMDGDSIRTTAEFAAVGDVVINDTVVTTPGRKWDMLRSQLDLVALLAGLVTALAASFAWIRKRYSPARR